MQQPSSARRRLRVPALVALSLIGASAMPWADSGAAPAINFHIVSAGHAALKNSCFRLSGTAAQAAPGYSSSTADSVLAGFWSAAPTTGLDEIFFNSFEDC